MLADVKWFDLQQTLARARSDVLFVFDTCYAMTAAQEPRQTRQGTKEYLVASGRKNRSIASGDFTFTKQFCASLRKLSYLERPISTNELFACLSLEKTLHTFPLH